MKNIIFSAFLLTALSCSLSAYDVEKAAHIEKFYAPMSQKVLANSKLFVSAEDFLSMARANKEMLLLDVRTPGEHSILKASYEQSLHIPINELFQKQNLDRLPKNKPIIVICHSGTRGLLAAADLLQIGFKDIHVLKGGFVALAQATTVKDAPLAP